MDQVSLFPSRLPVLLLWLIKFGVHQCFVATLLCQTKLIIMQEFRKGSHIFGPTIPFSHLYCLFYFCDWSNLMHCNVLLPLCCVGLVLLECILYSITFALIWHYSNKFRSTPQSNVLPHLKVLPIQDPKIWPNYWRKVGVKVALSTIWFSLMACYASLRAPPPTIYIISGILIDIKPS